MVSLNPFKDLEYLYTEGEVFKYHRWKLGDTDLPPHIYQIVALAYSSMQSKRENQGIIISGESGAGKLLQQRSAFSICQLLLVQVAA